MITLTLTEDQVKTYVTGLDSAIKLIAAQLSQANSAAPLRSLLPTLIDINKELLNLDKLLDEAQSKDTKINPQLQAALVPIEVVSSAPNHLTDAILDTSKP